MMEERLAKHYPMELFSTTSRPAKRKNANRCTDWLGHLQFSPTDPNAADVLPRRPVAQG
jgi:oligogalacturonide lyase